jgi:hypothetical protein
MAFLNVDRMELGPAQNRMEKILPQLQASANKNQRWCLKCELQPGFLSCQFRWRFS